MSSRLESVRVPRRPCGGRAWSVAWCAAATILLSGCYRYAATSDALRTGTEARVHLTETGAADLAPVLGRGTIVVSGRVISATDTSLVIVVSETRGPDTRVSWGGERVILPRSAIARAERRSLDRWRTVGVGAIGVGAAGMIALLVKELGSSSGGDDGGPIIIPP